jgi:hypothetical protein
MDVVNECPVKGGFTAEMHMENGVVVGLFKTDKFLGADWRPCKVAKNDTILWNWNKGQTAPAGYWGELFEETGGAVIVIRNKTVLHEVISITELSSRQPILVAGKKMFIGGASIESISELKRLVSEKLGIEPRYTTEERRALATTDEKQRKVGAMKLAKQRAIAEAGEKLKQAKAAERDAKFRAIMARTKIEAFGADGTKYWGVPVVGDEWMCLKDGTFVILTKEDDTPIEAFMVWKHGAGNPKKGKSHEVFAKNPVKTEETIEALRLIPRLSMKGETRENIPVFASVDNVRALREMGLNSGTWVAVPSSENEKHLVVHAVYHDRIDTVGVIKPKVQAPA